MNFETANFHAEFYFIYEFCLTKSNKRHEKNNKQYEKKFYKKKMKRNNESVKCYNRTNYFKLHIFTI